MMSFLSRGMTINGIVETQGLHIFKDEGTRPKAGIERHTSVAVRVNGKVVPVLN